MNTKTLFRYMRHDEQLRDIAQHKPVSIHVNYHPEKEERARHCASDPLLRLYWIRLPLPLIACTLKPARWARAKRSRVDKLSG
eukprot:4735382-Pleurochrysis_carterae.AAC.2